MKLLKIELRKVLSYSTVWVFLGLYIGIFIIATFVASGMETNVNGTEISLRAFFQFPEVWSMIPWMASWFNILLAMLIILLVGNEITFKTFRQHVASGLTRQELIISKLLLISVISVFSTVIITSLSLIYGVFFSENIISIFSKSYLIIVYFLQTFAYMSMGLMIVILLKNIALSIVSFLLYFFPVELIVRNFFPDNIAVYFPVKVISNLTPSPEFYAYAVKNLSQQQNIDSSQIVSPLQSFNDLSLLTNTVVATIYIVLFFSISYFVIKKRDL